MTLDALSFVTLAAVKLGECCAERMTAVYSVVRQVGESFVHCIVGVSWEVWPHTMSVRVVGRVAAGGVGQTNVDGYPKDLLVTCVGLTARVSRPNA